MATKLQFSLVSPARELFSGEVDHVIAPGTEGEFGVLVNHAPFMTTLKNGVVRVLDNGETRMRLFVRGGFADVTPAGLTILAEEAVNLDSVDAEQVEKDMQSLQGKMSGLSKGDGKLIAMQKEHDYLGDLKAALVA